MQPMEEIIGQERALRALRFGLEIRESGFNVYTAGAQGTGRMTAVRSFLDELAKAKPRASDWVYVHNFGDQYEPNAIALPAGKGVLFREDMERFVEETRRALPRAFESEEYAKRRDETLKSLQERRTNLIARINQRAQEQGFIIQMSPIGLLTIPVINGRPVPDEEFINLPEGCGPRSSGGGMPSTPKPEARSGRSGDRASGSRGDQEPQPRYRPLRDRNLVTDLKEKCRRP